MWGHTKGLLRERSEAGTQLDIIKHEMFRCILFLVVLQGVCILHSLLHIFESPMVHVAATTTLAVSWASGLIYVIRTSYMLECLIEVDSKTK